MKFYLNFILLILFIFFGLVLISKKKSFKMKNQMLLNSIECGFNSLINKNVILSINFFYILIIFIFFDLELMFLIPLFLFNKLNLVLIIFILFIFFSLIYEIKNKNINWL